MCQQLEIVISLTSLRLMVHPPSVLHFMDVYSYLKLNRKERSHKKDLRSHLEVAIRTSSTEGHALTNSANPSSYIQHFQLILVITME